MQISLGDYVISADSAAFCRTFAWSSKDHRRHASSKRPHDRAPLPHIKEQCSRCRDTSKSPGYDLPLQCCTHDTSSSSDSYSFLFSTL